MSRGNALAQIGSSQYHAQLGLPDKGRAIKGLVVCNKWDHLDGLALGSYQPSPEVLIVLLFSTGSITYIKGRHKKTYSPAHEEKNQSKNTQNYGYNSQSNKYSGSPGK